MLRKRALHVVIGLVTISIAATGCGRSTSGQTPQSGGAASVAADAKAADLVPADIKAKGSLRVATAEGYPPMEMYKAGTQDLTGVDPELAAAIAGRLGLKLEITNASFPGLIPGLQADRWDLAMSSMSDTEERRKAVDFVDYFQAGGSIMVAKGNPAAVKDLADLCGRAVVLAKGSSNLAIGEGQNATCAKKMTISQSEDAPTGLLQIDAGRAVATIVDYPVAKMLAQESGKYEVLEAQYEAGPWGIAIDKKDSQLRDAVQRALQELIDSGDYTKILEKWGVTGSAIQAATVNDQK
ncbi:ABC transporter substrate-binding protein [Micromonospora sp. CV4]|uniref:ABC transporter substrate-binding protein n=1 Tax=Micromonospora sp. CV4 TaxID=2478711 RepID=UPI000EF476A2|nr:ABC transporter substrate-binding protein [Micromonospora sp. CV4]RLP91322.1 ABC transporter substrate-binding protein [Micromonospora sp. CV4]